MAEFIAFGLFGLGVLWWLGVWISPTVRRLFDARSSRWWLDGLVLADVILFVGGHAVVGVLIRKRSKHACVTGAAVAGATTYAWLSCVGMLRFDGSWIAAVGMLGATVASWSVVLLTGEQR
jgi:hypothetical protein